MKTNHLKEYSRTKNSTINILTGVLGQILSILLKFIGRTVFIQTLGVSYLGINGLFSDILSMLSLAELGFDTAITYRLYKPVAEKNVIKIRAYLVFFRNIYWIIGFLIFLVGLLFIPALKFFIRDYDSLACLGINAGLIFFLFLIQNVSTYLFFAYRSIALKINQKQYVLDFAGYFVTILSTLVQIVVLLLFNDYLVYIITTTSFVILQNLFYAGIATKYYPQYFKGAKETLCKSEIIDLFKDCGALFVYKINNVVMKATDNIVLGAFVGLAIVGLYSNYLMIFVAVSGLLNIIFISLKASMGNLFVTNDLKKKYFFFEIMNMVTILLYGTAAISFAVVSNEIIECWIGLDYVLPQPLPIIIGVELLFTGLKLNLAQIRHVSGVFRQMWFRPAIGSAINVVASVVLVQFWGITGVILGTVLAAVFANLAIDPILIHKYSFENVKPVSYYYKKNIRFVLLFVLIGCFDFYVCSHLLIGRGIISVITHLLICIMSVFLIGSLVFRNREEYIYLYAKVKDLSSLFLQKYLKDK